MAFFADLHIHSKYSRATSRDLDLEHIAWWAARKGISVVGTGDCVHPEWLAALKDKLVPAGNGLFRLKADIEADIWQTLPTSCRQPVHFMLSVEISTIYKKADRTRKIHHLIYAIDFAAVDRLATSLARVGNIASDGRPILGLDSRDLLEIALESGPDSYLVPAHIWTPWFAALGSQSGFDSIAECYGDLSPHIFAVETGLSSDPQMNWRVSFLDRYRLTSNSDAHSPAKLGREATGFSCDPSYLSIRRALETGEGYQGTVEFFPEEGKYHLDGHRACGVRFEPAETIAHNGRCPVCGGTLTVGVAHRVEKLADRSEAEVAPPATAGKVTSLVPLPEILSEIACSGPASKAVSQAYDRATAALGPELSMLTEVPVEDIARAAPLLGEAVSRLRSGSVIRQAGYDGEYGVIKLFEERELDRLTKGELLFEAPVRRRTRAARPASVPVAEQAPLRAPVAVPPSLFSGVLAGLDPDQAAAARAIEGPIVVLAGPGSGKTRMLTHRLAHLIAECGVDAGSCLAITFTRRATEELRERLSNLLPRGARACTVESFHSLGLKILRAHGSVLGLTPDFRIASETEWTKAIIAALCVSESRARSALRALSLLKRTRMEAQGEAGDALAACRRLAREHNWLDFDDLICLAVEILEMNKDIAAWWRERFHHICVDEFQDVDEAQYRLLQLLVSPKSNICAIGDPNQAIYGFRGADATCFERFRRDFPDVRTMTLRRNYRSTGTIVTAGTQVIHSGTPAKLMRPMQEPITLHAAPNERMEAEFVAAAIEELLGGHDMLAANRGSAEGRKARPLSFADFAVLYRTDAQSQTFRDAFDRAGIPFKKSTPAPISGQPAVRALLGALERQRGDADLATRIAVAAEHVRKGENPPDAATLAEAQRWLTALAGSGDEARLREQAALSTEADFWDPRADRVSLLTMHAAKGLEFAVVFVVGMENGLMPFSWGDVGSDDGRSEAEERRLFYVAMTRAKDRLFLTRAVERFWHGQVRLLPPSPFLRSISQELTASDTLPARKRRRDLHQYSLF